MYPIGVQMESAYPTRIALRQKRSSVWGMSEMTVLKFKHQESIWSLE